VQHEPDLGEAELGATQQSDQLAGADLTGRVAPIAGVGIDRGRAQQPGPLVDPQRLAAQAGSLRELPGRQPRVAVAVSIPIGHLAILAPAPGARSTG
jgi:hypothetical protein